MNFDFAISRIATFARPDFCKSVSIEDYTLSGSSLFKKFHEQAQHIAANNLFKNANDAAWEIARGFDSKATRKKCTKPDSPDGIGELAILNLAEEFGGASTEVQGSDTLVARMPSERIQLAVGGVDWILRTRAHFTSCALEGNKRPTKLWWTYEGIPADNDPNARPHREAVSALLTVANKMEDAVRDGLTEAFEESFVTVTAGGTKGKVSPDKNRLNITITEGLDDGVDALLDALYFDDKTPSKIVQSDLELARRGLDTFEWFVHRVAGTDAKIDDASVSLAEGIPKVKGILWHRTDKSSHLVAGFARKAGARIGLRFMSDEERREELVEQQVRMRSAARPWSALLANNEAIKFEQSLGLN